MFQRAEKLKEAEQGERATSLQETNEFKRAIEK